MSGGRPRTFLSAGDAFGILKYTLGGKPQCCCILLEDAEVLQLLATVCLAFTEWDVLGSRMALKALNTTVEYIQWDSYTHSAEQTNSLTSKKGRHTMSPNATSHNKVHFCITSNRWLQPQLPWQNSHFGERTAGSSCFQGHKLLLPPQETGDSVFETDF